MDILLSLFAIPLIGAAVLAFWGDRPRAGAINALLSLGTLCQALVVAVQVVLNDGKGILFLGGQFYVDALSTFLLVLTAIVGFSTALFSSSYIRVEREHGKMTVGSMRIYHSMFQMFMAMMMLSLTANNMGLMWVAMEGATLATVLLVAIYHTPASMEAAWKYFILCGVGIAQALFGTILLYLAAEKVLGGALAPESGTLLWTTLASVKEGLNPTIISIAFVFLLLGYGTKVGLFPVHSWLPDAYAEAPAPVATLSGLLLNVALYAILRCKVLADGALQNGLPGHTMVAFGLVSVVAAAFFIRRQKDVKRMLGYSSIEHMGLMTFAFGLGGPVANFAGLLHMTVHSFVKSSLFYSVGHAVQKAGTQVMDDLHALMRVCPTTGWGILLGGFAIVGMPPFGLFASEFLILTTAINVMPWAGLVLLLALGVAFAAMIGRIQSMVFGGVGPLKSAVAPMALIPVFIHLGIALVLGLYIPHVLNDWYQHAAQMIW